MELMAQRRSDGVALIEEHGGMKSLADHLKTDLKTGISCNPGELEARKSAFGSNFIPPSPPRNFLALCLDAVQDKTLLILIGAAIISIILGVTVEEQKVIHLVIIGRARRGVCPDLSIYVIYIYVTVFMLCPFRL